MTAGILTFYFKQIYLLGFESLSKSINRSSEAGMSFELGG